MAKKNYLVLDGCPVPRDVAPYIYLILRRAGLTAASIYRGDSAEARAILNRHGKHTQRQLWNASPSQRAAWGVTGTPNRPGRSMHELRSDGVAKSGPVGRALQPWEVGVDSGPNTNANRQKLHAAAAYYGLEIYFPYNFAVEYHHWGFKKKPTYDGKRLYRTRVIWTRALLARNK